MSLAEAQTGLSPLAAELAEGIASISSNQVITFNLYAKIVLPLDGYVFLVKSTLLTDSALYGLSQYGTLPYGNASDTGLAKTLQVKGSLHYATELQQQIDQNSSRNYVIFTTQEKIQDFNFVNPNLIYIAEFEDIKFAFSKTANFYKQAQVYHYRGDALYSIMDTQVIDSMENFDTSNVIVSNSLPLWLSLNKYFQVYPAFLSLQNSDLPYATVYIDPKTTQALQAAPYIAIDSSHYQLTKETVTIQVTGIRNNIALEFQDYVLDYSRNTDNFGLMNSPVFQDDHLTQKELGILAMRKTITFEINYYQKNILDIAQKLILSAMITLNPQ